jgi:hypothetical protein
MDKSLSIGDVQYLGYYPLVPISFSVNCSSPFYQLVFCDSGVSETTASLRQGTMAHSLQFCCMSLPKRLRWLDLTRWGSALNACNKPFDPTILSPFVLLLIRPSDLDILDFFVSRQHGSIIAITALVYGLTLPCLPTWKCSSRRRNRRMSASTGMSIGSIVHRN